MVSRDHAIALQPDDKARLCLNRKKKKKKEKKERKEKPHSDILQGGKKVWSRRGAVVQ